MPRMIRFDAMGPIKIEPQNFPKDAEGNLKPIFICACGLTRNPPFCDGMHKACRASERPDVLYTYDRATGAVLSEQPMTPPPATGADPSPSGS